MRREKPPTGISGIRVGGARTYRGQHRYDGDLGGTLGSPVKLGLHTIPTLDPLMDHIPSGRYAPPTGIRYSSDAGESRIGSLCVAAPFCLFVFVETLFEFIEFGWLDVQNKTQNLSAPTSYTRPSRSRPVPLRRNQGLRYRSLRIVPSSLVSITNFSKFLLYNSLSSDWASSWSNQNTWLVPALVRVSRT